MAEGFLEKYNDELFALRKRASRFAAAFPKIAGRLRMTGDVADDPHVERLIQSFAYSAARVRQKLDDAAPEWAFIHTHFGIGNRFSPEPRAQ